MKTKEYEIYKAKMRLEKSFLVENIISLIVIVFITLAVPPIGIVLLIVYLVSVLVTKRETRATELKLQILLGA